MSNGSNDNMSQLSLCEMITKIMLGIIRLDEFDQMWLHYKNPLIFKLFNLTTLFVLTMNLVNLTKGC